MKDIEKILAPFNLILGQKQDLATLLIHLRDNEVSIDRVIAAKQLPEGYTT